MSCDSYRVRTTWSSAVCAKVINFKPKVFVVGVDATNNNNVDLVGKQVAFGSDDMAHQINAGSKRLLAATSSFPGNGEFSR